MRFNPLDIVGNCFGRLSVAAYNGKVGGHHTYTCTCECGLQVAVKRGLLLTGRTKSCGCLFKEVCWKNRTTHGESNRHNGISPEYRAWAAMRDRCKRKTHPSYHNYGGRGITVCAEWDNSFEQFLLDVGRRPTSEHSLERTDNDRGYVKGNVEWIPRKQQALNRRTTRLIKFEGVTKSLTQWAESLGISKTTLHSRLRNGWELGEALKAPTGSCRKGSEEILE